jgi:hypothetical protein
MSMMGFLTLFLQPLAGSVLNIEQIGLPEGELMTENMTIMIADFCQILLPLAFGK